MGRLPALTTFLRQRDALLEIALRPPRIAGVKQRVAQSAEDLPAKQLVCQAWKDALVKFGGLLVRVLALGVIGSLDADRDGVLPQACRHQVMGQVDRRGAGKLTEGRSRSLVQALPLLGDEILVDGLPSECMSEPIPAVGAGVLFH